MDGGSIPPISTNAVVARYGTLSATVGAVAAPEFDPNAHSLTTPVTQVDPWSDATLSRGTLSVRDGYVGYVTANREQVFDIPASELAVGIRSDLVSLRYGSTTYRVRTEPTAGEGVADVSVLVALFASIFSKDYAGLGTISGARVARRIAKAVKAWQRHLEDDVARAERRTREVRAATWTVVVITVAYFFGMIAVLANLRSPTPPWIGVVFVPFVVLGAAVMVLRVVVKSAETGVVEAQVRAARRAIEELEAELGEGDYAGEGDDDFR